MVSSVWQSAKALPLCSRTGDSWEYLEVQAGVGGFKVRPGLSIILHPPPGCTWQQGIEPGISSLKWGFKALFLMEHPIVLCNYRSWSRWLCLWRGRQTPGASALSPLIFLAWLRRLQRPVTAQIRTEAN